MKTGLLKAALDHMNNGGHPGAMISGAFWGSSMDGQAVNDNMAFLVGELEKIDPRLLEPLLSFTYARDITLKPGGGWVQYASTIDVDYATTGGNSHGIVGPSTTEIARTQANLNKDLYQVFTFLNSYSVGFVNNQLVLQTGRSLEEIFDKGIRLTYNKALDNSVYFGFKDYGSTGLVNNPNVDHSAVAYGAGTAGGNGTGTAGTALAWVDKTPAEILADVNALITFVWSACEYSGDGFVNQIGLPPAQFALLQKPNGSIGNMSIMSYLLENNISKANGVDLKIVPMRQLIGAGAGTPATDRMVGYINDELRLNVDVTVPISRIMTAPNISNASIDSIYASQFSENKLQYLQTIAYRDGI